MCLMLSLSEGHNPNYTAQVVEISKIDPHPNADRLQIATINFQPVIVWLNTKIGDRWVYFPVESQIDSDFLKQNNMYSSQLLNKNTEVKGYMGKKGRVKATRLRGEYSMGLFIPQEAFESTTGEKITDESVNVSFDTTKKGLLVWKYIIPVKTQNNVKVPKKARQSRVINFEFHQDTENLRRNAYKLNLDDTISITYKLHWTSAVFSNTRVLKKMWLFSRILKKIWVPIQDTEYDLLYSSRRVIKNAYLDEWKTWFYDTDPWTEVAKDISIPKWYSIYWEIVWYQSTGGWIQWNYDYWCLPCQKELYVYKVTFTNDDWLTYTISTPEALSLAQSRWLSTPELYYNWTVANLLEQYNIKLDSHRQEELVIKLEELYNNKKCHMCKNDVWAEGIVLRVEKNNTFEAYKLKCKNFLYEESKVLDSQSNNDKS